MMKKDTEYTLAEAAQKAGVTVPAIRYWIKIGALSGRKVISRVYIDKESLHKYIKDNTEEF